MIVIQNILFTFVFVNLHYHERLYLFQECDFCFICMQISCFPLNRYRLIQLESWICCVLHISNVYVVFWIRNKPFSGLTQFLVRGDIILKIKVWCSLNSCSLYAGHYCMYKWQCACMWKRYVRMYVNAYVFCGVVLFRTKPWEFSSLSAFAVSLSAAVFYQIQVQYFAFGSRETKPHTLYVYCAHPMREDFSVRFD